MVAKVKQQYREVERKANVGETVKVAKLSSHRDFNVGDILVIKDVQGYDDGKRRLGVGKSYIIYDGEYVVLEPAYDDLIANLSAEVARLSKRVETLEDRLKPTIKGRFDDWKTDKTKPLTRDEIVAKAKADLADLRKRMGDGNNESVGNEWVRGFTTTPEFIVNKDKRTVVALVKFLYGGRIVSKGIAKASTDDCFNAHIGKAIAVRRALGLEVPKEYTQCPQPKGVKVGDILKWEHVDCTYRVLTTANIPGNIQFVGKYNGAKANGDEFKYATVIDDSARYE